MTALINRRWLIGSLAAASLVPRLAARAATEQPELSVQARVHTADFDDMLARGVVRVLAPYSRTLFFENKGSFAGLTAEMADELEKYLRLTHPEKKKELTVVIIPTSRNRLIPDLLAGLGDVSAVDITVTPERQKLVRFVTAGLKVNEIVVTGPNAPPLAAAEDLSGREVASRPSTSTFDSLRALNDRLAAAGKPPVRIIDVPPALEVEDMLEMVGAGLLPACTAEDWVADLWQPLIPGIVPNKKAVLRANAELGWAVRPDNPKLADMLGAFAAKYGGGSPQQFRDTMTYYMKQVRRLHAATNPDELKKFEATLDMFKTYGSEYGFDYLMLVAQGYQESLLDQGTRSPAGAIGLMQLLPSTGKLMAVGDIGQPEPNVHAGAKYLRQLIDTYLSDNTFDAQNRTLFAFACYNAGPNKIERLRQEAKQEGLDANVWFDNVERIAARRIGQETVRYVRNIYKYYAGYKLLVASREAVAAGKAEVKASDKP